MSEHRIIFAGGPLDGKCRVYPQTQPNDLWLPKSDGSTYFYVNTDVQIAGCDVYVYKDS